MKGKRVLVVYAHLEPRSFTGAIKDQVIKSLTEAGASVVLSDLYEMNFDPVIKQSDYQDRAVPDYFKIPYENRCAALKGTLNPQVRDETDKLIAADYVITICPMWWGSVPAILKGWFEKVLIPGIAWDWGKAFQGGLCVGKKVLNIISCGIPGDKFALYAGQDLESRLHHITHATFAFCGFDVIQFLSFHSVGQISNDEREKMLENVAETMKTLDTRPLMDKMSP